MEQLIVASGTAPTEDDRRLARLAEEMGVPAVSMRVEDVPAIDPPRIRVAMSAVTLARAHASVPALLERLVRRRCRTLLVFGCDDPGRHSAALAWLTSGKIRGVAARGSRAPSVLEFPRGGREFNRQLAGLVVPAGRDASVLAFEGVDDAVSSTPIMQADGRPAFLRTSAGDCDVFLLGGADLPDVDAPTAPDAGLDVHYDRLVPILIFLRHAFGERCWHGPGGTSRFIVDDPLLAERYGFLDYRALMDSMGRAGYGTTIAFIPWNHRRTSARVAARLFAQRPDFSICVHGCDHSNREFEAADPGLLARKAGLALERMGRHETRTGLSFEPVMVFPQGRFSHHALQALRDANYLAAVNSTCLPTTDGQDRLTIAELLRPAVTRFHGFPVFHRRYPRHLADTAFDLFLGKPALLVEHHQYFRDGFECLEAFVAGLRALEPGLTWPSLSVQLARSCRMRSTGPQEVEVQFFTRRFRLQNTAAERRRFRLTKHEPDLSAIRAVVVGGVGVPFAWKDHRVEVDLEIDPGRSIDVELLDEPRPRRAAPPASLRYRTGVLVRRALSEFRDNTLSRHPRLLRAAAGLTRRLRVAGDRRDGV